MSRLWVEDDASGVPLSSPRIDPQEGERMERIMNKVILMGLLIAVTMLQGTAFGQVQTRKQQNCINALNKGMAKVSFTQSKANARCITRFAKGKEANAATCLGADAKVAKAAVKTCAAEVRRCNGITPDFGKTSCGLVAGVSEYHGSSLAEDMFGASVNAGVTACSTDKKACRCQAQLLRGVNKLLATHLREFNKCKKNGLRSKTAPFMNIAALDTCVASDPKMKISKAQIKVGNIITKRCAAVATPLGAGSCAGMDGAALSVCLQERTRCRACLTAQVSDGLGVDCEVFDDGLSNNSCTDDF